MRAPIGGAILGASDPLKEKNGIERLAYFHAGGIPSAAFSSRRVRLGPGTLRCASAWAAMASIPARSSAMVGLPPVMTATRYEKPGEVKVNSKSRAPLGSNSVTIDVPPQLITHEPSPRRWAEPQQ